MKYIHLLLCLSIFTSMQGQENLESLVNQGVKYHDEGDYEKAIEYYVKALNVDSTKSTIYYEMALSYYSLKNYNKVLELADKVIAKNDNNLSLGFAIKGSALDMLDRTAESTALLEEAIRITKGDPTLYYNLAINYWKAGRINMAEENFINVIDKNPSHASSHYMLSVLNDEKGNAIKAILAGEYFLLLEPNSKRSEEVNRIIDRNYIGHVSKDADNPNNTIISIDPGKDTTFFAAELGLNLISTSRQLDSLMSEDEFFKFQTTSLYTVLGETTKEPVDIWTAFYIPFYYVISKSPHMETYCRYIRQKVSKESHDWLLSHDKELMEFGKWLSSN